MSRISLRVARLCCRCDLVVRFEQVELGITLEWTGHKELNYCKNGGVKGRR
jgi:hypothetical protein